MKITIRESNLPRQASLVISMSKAHKSRSEYYHGEMRKKLSSSVNLVKRKSLNDTDETFMITIASAFEDKYSDIPRTNIAQCDLTREQLIELRFQADYMLNYTK